MVFLDLHLMYIKLILQRCERVYVTCLYTNIKQTVVFMNTFQQK